MTLFLNVKKNNLFLSLNNSLTGNYHGTSERVMSSGNKKDDV